MNCGELHNLEDLYVDGELATPVVSMLRAHMQRCADCRAQVDERRALNAAIRRTASRYPAPPLLTARLRRSMKAPSRGFGSLRYLGTGWNPAAMAASLLLAIATSVGVTHSYLAPDHEDQVVGQVVASHIRSLMDEHLTDVAFTPSSNMRPFFAGKVEAVPPVVARVSAAYTLVGGRLDYVADHRCAALVYRGGTHVIDLEVWNRGDADRDTAESYSREGYNLVHVVDGNLDYWAVSDLSRGELGAFMHDFVAAAQTDGEKA